MKKVQKLLGYLGIKSSVVSLKGKGDECVSSSLWTSNYYDKAIYNPHMETLSVMKKMFLHPLDYAKEYEERIRNIRMQTAEVEFPLQLSISEILKNPMAFSFDVTITIEKENITEENTRFVKELLLHYANEDKCTYFCIWLKEKRWYLEIFRGVIEPLMQAEVLDNGEECIDRILDDEPNNQAKNLYKMFLAGKLQQDIEEITKQDYYSVCERFCEGD